MAFYLPDEETLDPDGLLSLQRRKLAALFHQITGRNAFWTRRFAGAPFDPRTDSLQTCPFTSRSEIEADQRDHPPYGTNLTYGLESYSRLHQTSGTTSGQPLRWLDTAESWTWWKRCWGTIYRAAGVTPTDRFVFPFSFGPFVGFWGAFETATSMGNLSLAAGGMTTKARLEYLLDNKATVVGCTPTYALRMAEVADEEGFDLAGSPVRALIVAGEPGGSVPSIRQQIEAKWGARVFDHAGMTEVGPWGFECQEAPGGLHVMENEFIAEVIEPRGDAVVPDGQVGELVLTNLGRWGSPLFRYRTGDLVRLIRGRCACGRWFARADGGILGRTDDMLIVRGNNVYPTAIEGVIREFSEVAEFVAEVDQRAALPDLRITVEPVNGVNGAAVARRVAEAMRDRFHFSPTVVAAEPGSLPRYEMKAKRWTRKE